jgi:transcriptional regulator with XRE-family HTH domain
MNARQILAWNIRRLRTARGISQERLAADARVARTYLGEIERAQKAASVDTLDKLALVLDVAVAEFLREPPEGEERPAALPGGRRPS